MPRTNLHTGAGSPAPFTLDDRLIMAGLVIVSLSGWGGNIYQTQAFMAVILGFCALCFWMGDKLLAAFGAYLSIWYVYLFCGTTTEPAQIANSLHLMTWAVIVYLIVRFGRGPVSGYLAWLTVLGAILSILGINSHLWGHTSIATLGNQNFLGAFLAIVGLACFKRGRYRWLFLILPALWFCSSSTPIAAFCAGVGFILWRWKGVALGTIIGAAYFFGLDNGSLIHTDRVDFWIDAVRQVSASPVSILFGMGPGIDWNPGVNMLHSEYAYILWNLGIVGLILAAIYVWRSFRINVDRRLGGMMVAILVDAIGNHLFHTIPTAFLAVIVFGLNDRRLKPWQTLER